MSLYVEGPDLFLIISSIALIVLTYALITRKLLHHNLRRIWPSLILVAIAITILYAYTVYVNTPLTRATYLELSKPIECTKVYGQTLCLLDVFNTSSLIYIYTNQSLTMIIYQDTVEYERYELNPGENLTLYYNGGVETRIALITSGGEPSLIYRRISFQTYNDHGYTPLLISLYMIVLLLILVYIRR